MLAHWRASEVWQAGASDHQEPKEPESLGFRVDLKLPRGLGFMIFELGSSVKGIWGVILWFEASSEEYVRLYGDLFALGSGWTVYGLECKALDMICYIYIYILSKDYALNLMYKNNIVKIFLE